MTTETKIASESQHWYYPDGRPCYEVEAKKGGMKPTTIKEARQLGLVPSVTLITNCAAKPGLEAWKAQQLVMAALTLPKLDGEALDAYASRVISDSKEQAKKAAERGTALHTAIEQFIQGKRGEAQLGEFWEHAYKVHETLAQYDVNLGSGQVEHSFAHELGYGGKVDFHKRGTSPINPNNPLTIPGFEPHIIVDFKSKQKIENGKQLAWDEHKMQLAAYSYGVFGATNARALNVFVGIEDCEVRVIEHTPQDLAHAFTCFRHILSFWQTKNKYP